MPTTVKQSLVNDDRAHRLRFCTEMLHHFEGDSFAEKFIFSDEATFRLHGKVNRRRVRTWRTENPHSAIENIRNSPEMNVFHVISIKKVYGSFLFSDTNHWHILYLYDAGMNVPG